MISVGVRSRKIPPRGLNTSMGCAFPERSVTSPTKNLTPRENVWGLTASLGSTWMVFSGVGLGSSARAFRESSTLTSNTTACANATRWEPIFASVISCCAIRYSQFPSGSILSSALVSAAKLPAISTLGKRHEATLASVSSLSPLVIPAPVAQWYTPPVERVPSQIPPRCPMFSPSRLVLVLALAAALSSQAVPHPQVGPQPPVPETPAAHTFKPCFEASTSRARPTIDAYFHKYDPSKPLDNTMQFRGMTGGFDLLQIVKSEPLHLEFLVKERRGDTQAIGKLDVQAGDPAQV